MRGRILQQLQRLDEAVLALEHAFEVDARNAAPLTQAALIEYELGRSREASESFRVAMQRDPGGASPRIGLAMIAIDAGDLDQAETLLAEGRPTATMAPSAAIFAWIPAASSTIKANGGGLPTIIA